MPDDYYDLDDDAEHCECCDRPLIGEGAYCDQCGVGPLCRACHAPGWGDVDEMCLDCAGIGVDDEESCCA